MQEDLIVYKEEYELIKKVLVKIIQNTKAEIAFISDSEGHCIAATGRKDEGDLNSISSLIAGSVAAVGSIGQMLGISSFNHVLAESDRKSLYISEINPRIMLVVFFDKNSNLGLVRLRVKKASEELELIFKEINRKLEEEILSQESPFESVSDEEIDEIFGD
jgi:predicted regulator of Ras-like GTPase activity (Roadblock/LC7/MglB family)